MKTIEMAREAGFKMENSAAIDAARNFADLIRADERKEIYQQWHSCVMADLENRVKSFEKVASDWHNNYPAQSKMFPEWIEIRGNK